MIRSTSPIQRKTQLPFSPLDFAFGSQQLVQTLQELRDMKDRHEKEHAARIAEIDTAIAHALKIQKGDKGDTPVAGIHFPIPKDGKSVDHAKVVADVLKQIRQPKDGETPVIDYEQIARKAVALIPKPKDGTSVDKKEVLADVLKHISEGKLKLSIKHIEGFNEGLEQTIAPIRHLAAGFKGGGDTVTAGTGVTITTDTNGKKVISAGSSGTSIYNEVVGGSGNTFTLASTPIAGTVRVYGNGQRLTPTTDYSIAGKIITTVDSWSAGQITADYNK